MFSYLLLIAGLGLGVAHGQLTQLEDGIRIHEGASMAIGEGLWTLLLTINQPSTDFRKQERELLLEQVDVLQDLIDGETLSAIITPPRKALWEKRLRLIKQDHSIHFEIQSRQKRGLIDAGGWILNKVFGTATEGQLRDIRHQLGLSSRKQAVVVHNTRRLMTIVNQTRLEAKETRKRLDDLGLAHNSFVRDERGRWTSLQHVTRVLMIENMI